MPGEPDGLALEVFYSCATQDELLRRELENQLKLLERQRLIIGWHRGLIPPGVDQQKVEQHLQSASVILLLLAPEYVASDECYAQMERALDRYNAGQALVVPILMRPVEFAELPVASLQPLPTGGEAVSRCWLPNLTRRCACGTSPMGATCCSRDGRTCSTNCMTA